MFTFMVTVLLTMLLLKVQDEESGLQRDGHLRITGH